MVPRSRSQKLIAVRPYVQWTSTISFIVAMGWFQLNLWWVLLAGIATAPFGGKFFCRWLCPMGLLMETMSHSLDEKSRAQQHYHYYKLGCPIAWAGGLFNRWSLFKIKFNPDNCTHCGKCDSHCYLPANAHQTSLHRPKARFAAHTYQCSRCGACVSACSSQALSLGIGSDRTINTKEIKS